jgi:hypothetical protein
MCWTVVLENHFSAPVRDRQTHKRRSARVNVGRFLGNVEARRFGDAEPGFPLPDSCVKLGKATPDISFHSPLTYLLIEKRIQCCSQSLQRFIADGQGQFKGRSLSGSATGGAP